MVLELILRRCLLSNSHDLAHLFADRLYELLNLLAARLCCRGCLLDELKFLVEGGLESICLLLDKAANVLGILDKCCEGSADDSFQSGDGISTSASLIIVCGCSLLRWLLLGAKVPRQLCGVILLHILLQLSIRGFHRLDKRIVLGKLVRLLVLHQHLGQVELTSALHVADVRHGLGVHSNPAEGSNRLGNGRQVVFERVLGRSLALHLARLAHLCADGREHGLEGVAIWLGLLCCRLQQLVLLLESSNEACTLLFDESADGLARLPVLLDRSVEDGLECRQRVGSSLLLFFLFILVFFIALGRLKSSVPAQAHRVVLLDKRLERLVQFLDTLDECIMLGKLVRLLVLHQHLGQVELTSALHVADVRHGLGVHSNPAEGSNRLGNGRQVVFERVLGRSLALHLARLAHLCADGREHGLKLISSWLLLCRRRLQQLALLVKRLRNSRTLLFHQPTDRLSRADELGQRPIKNLLKCLY
mmetsp:Transcript_8075/g.24329  ORF Transcript_8075/g.24329 Transcript_8075/m.24329 type:complete len:476 (+) Transcript_8075:340-1767(+)